MAKKITIEFDGKWILEHRGDERLPVDRLRDEFAAKNFTVESYSFTTLCLVTAAGQAAEQAEEVVRSVIESLYPDENLSGVFSVSTDENADDLFSEKTATATQTAEAPKKATATEADGVLAKVQKLTGAAEFKQLIGEILAVAPQINKQNAQRLFYNRSYLFSIGDGCGLSTYLELLAQAVAQTGLRRMHPRPVIEERLGPYKESMEPFEEVLKTLQNGDSDRVRVLCIDINEWLNKTGTQYFRLFLRAIEKSAEEFIVVFRVAFLDKAVLSDLGYSLNDQLSVKTISFPPFSSEELRDCAQRDLAEYGYEMSPKGWAFFQQRLTEEKSDGKFYGLSTVKKVVRELVYNKMLSNVRRNSDDKVISASEAKSLCRVKPDQLSGEEQLNKLVGNEEVKKKINEILAQIELAMSNESEERPCIHMRFVGNPGTGKTTVARILGKILKERGVLRVGNFYEYAGRDFCGRYIGETAPKTASICRDAYGSVLFIDEAYSLYRGDGNDRDFGREALDTLIAEMENHRNDFVVIMAGYTDDMDKLMKGNHGLASRMPYTIEFPNFTRDQLYMIFESLVKTRFKYDDDLLERAKNFFTALPNDVINAKEFSNARFVRNLFERTWAKAAMRCQLARAKDVVLTKDDFERACGEKEFALSVYRKPQIGF